jgi:hypothetical protein
VEVTVLGLVFHQQPLVATVVQAVVQVDFKPLAQTQVVQEHQDKVTLVVLELVLLNMVAVAVAVLAQ